MKHQLTFIPTDATSASLIGQAVTSEAAPAQPVISNAPDGISLFNAANWAGLAIDSTCGARGTCGKCKVRVAEGSCAIGDVDRRFLNAEELAAGWRLSCRATVHSDCVVEVPRMMTSPKAALLGYGRHVILDANVHKVHLKLTEPSLEDQRSDVRRVIDALQAAGYHAKAVPSVWRALPKMLRKHAFDVTAVIVGEELIAVEPGDTSQEIYGLSLDIGTTTVVGAILHLGTGQIMAVESALNSQASFGADVIARISHTMMQDDGLTVLHARIVSTINQLIDQLLTRCDATRWRIYEVLAVGNATMLHLLLGIDPEAIGVGPFIPTVDEAVTVPAADVGLELHPEARLSTLPHMGAYVGADIVAGVLATDLTRNKDRKIRLFIDVGTNGEIVLGSVDRALATAAPAGPAFEGAQIKCGMRASAGAIEGVRLTDDVELQLIGGAQEKVRGICGSGLVDAVAEFVRVGLVDPSGRLAKADAVAGKLPKAIVDRLVERDGVRAFLLSSAEDDVYLTQPDIRALQFAKAAIASGSMVLMEKLGVTAADLEEVLLGGSFGAYINPESARVIGLVPWIPVNKIIAVGNSAGEGAKIALLSYREREVATRIPEFVEYLELSGRTEFNDIFMDALAFPAAAVLPAT
jgi:uncharacterized 2Fe-2S/4Fe-4S cluster protein (DUF4445 family)